tara:strand:+ start:515 stop:2206 length:1692 start_codon:yes stop_codon:yes gene_type:complete
MISAQDIERLKPRVPEVEATAPVAEVADSDAGGSPASADDEVLGTIHGITLIGHPDLASKDTPPNVKGVEVLDEELVAPESVLTALEPFIGGPLSVKTIQDLSQTTVKAYREADMPVVDVGFPEQNVSTGVLQLVVVVGKAGEITVEGNQHFKDRIYLRSFRTQTGDVLRQSVVLEDLKYLNRSRYRQVRANYTPGEDFGEADVVLEAEERFPFSAYAGYEDTGNELIGIDRLLFGLEWGNVFGWDHSLAYQYTTVTEFDGLHGHAWIYRIPIPRWRHEFRVLGAYVTSDASFQAAGETLNTGGQSVQITPAYIIPLPDLFGYEQELSAAFDFKSTNNDLEFGGAQVIDSTAEVSQFSLGQTLTKTTKLGRQLISNRLVWSPGELSNHNSDDAFQELRGLGSADYFYWSGEFTQVIDLPQGFTFVGDLEAQLSTQNLLPSETLVLGGATSVRGFEQNITRADQGLILNLELYSPVIRPLEMVGIDQANDRFRAFAFFDYATASNVNLLPGEGDGIHLGGAGLGLDYQLFQHLSLRAAHAWQVSQSGFEDDQNARWHLSGTVRW